MTDAYDPTRPPEDYAQPEGTAEPSGVASSGGEMYQESAEAYPEPATELPQNQPHYRVRLGDILVANGDLTAEQLQWALSLQAESKKKLGELLISFGWVTEETLAASLCKLYGHSFISVIDINHVDPSLKSIIPDKMVRENMIFPYEREGTLLKLIMCDPDNLYLMDELKLITGYPHIEVLLTTPTILKKAITDLYDTATTMSSLLNEIDEDDFQVIEDSDEKVSAAELRAQTEDTPVIKMVNLIIREALKMKATDIHLEPYERSFRVRYRIDGILYEVPSPPQKYHGAIISRLKIMADLDIAERRLPQDGRFKLRIGNTEVDFRIATLPTAFGEKVAMRILDKSNRVSEGAGSYVGLENLGFAQEQLDIVRRNVTKPYGMIIVAGPTGSGKTTTLYSCLEVLNAPDKNIVTVEDPVEYMIPGINQVAVRSQIGLNFASALRSLLRQDPDVIMIGEIRDQETAEIAINAALTGHMVLSTLHTNDSPGAIVRLDNMGVEPYLVTSSLLLVIAQRLMRKICMYCREPYQPSEELLRAMHVGHLDPGTTLYRGVGCEACSRTGYKGRVGVYELLEMAEDVKGMILKRATSTEIKSHLLPQGFKTLRASSLDVVLQGLTTLEEMMRVSTEDQLIKA